MLSYFYCKNLSEIRLFLHQLIEICDFESGERQPNEENNVLQFDLNHQKLVFFESYEDFNHHIKCPFIFHLKTLSHELAGKVVFQDGESSGPRLIVVEAPDGTLFYCGDFPPDSSATVSSFVTSACMKYLTSHLRGKLESKVSPENFIKTGLESFTVDDNEDRIKMRLSLCFYELGSELLPAIKKTNINAINIQPLLKTYCKSKMNHRESLDTLRIAKECTGSATKDGYNIHDFHLNNVIFTKDESKNFRWDLDEASFQGIKGFLMGALRTFDLDTIFKEHNKDLTLLRQLLFWIKRNRLSGSIKEVKELQPLLLQYLSRWVQKFSSLIRSSAPPSVEYDAINANGIKLEGHMTCHGNKDVNGRRQFIALVDIVTFLLLNATSLLRLPTYQPLKMKPPVK
jgi:hypothetical protein